MALNYQRPQELLKRGYITLHYFTTTVVKKLHYLEKFRYENFEEIL